MDGNYPSSADITVVSILIGLDSAVIGTTQRVRFQPVAITVLSIMHERPYTRGFVAGQKLGVGGPSLFL